MNSIRFLLFLWGLSLVVTTISCDSSPAIKFPETRTAACTDLPQTPFLGLPMQLCVLKNKLFISDYHGDSILIGYSLSRQQPVEKRAPQGDGPFSIGKSVHLSLTDTSLTILDKSNFKLGYYPRIAIDSLIEQYRIIGKISYDIMTAAPIDSNQFIAAVFSNEGRYALLNERGEIMRFFGDYPAFKTDESMISFGAKAMFHQGFFVVNVPQKRAAFVSKYVLDLIDLSGSVPSVLNRIQLAPYDYWFETGSVTRVEARGENTPGGAFSPTGNSDFIYFIFNPNTPTTQPAKPREIWVFNWEGEPIRKIIPSKRVQDIGVSADNQLFGLYTKGENPSLISITLE